MKRSKYNAQKTYVNDIRFDSKAEARRYKVLKLLEKSGAIHNLILQPEFELIPTYKHKGKTIRKTVYRADFQYTMADGRVVIEDVKGVTTDVFKLKKKLFEYQHPELSITLVRGA